MNRLHQFIHAQPQKQPVLTHDHDTAHSHDGTNNGVTIMGLIGRFAHQGESLSDYRSTQVIHASNRTMLVTVLVLVVGVVLSYVLPANLSGVALAFVVVGAAHLAILVLGGLAMTLFVRYQRGTSRRMLINAIPWRGAEKVLDVGCGTGMMLNGCAQKLTTGKAIGVDLWQQPVAGSSSVLLKNARAEGVADKVTYQEMDARHLTFEDASFDVVVTSFALHHIGTQTKDREQAVNQMIRVLKPGGYLAVLDVGPMIDIAESVIAQAGLEIVQSKETHFFRLVTVRKAA